MFIWQNETWRNTSHSYFMKIINKYNDNEYSNICLINSQEKKKKKKKKKNFKKFFF